MGFLHLPAGELKILHQYVNMGYYIGKMETLLPTKGGSETIPQ